ncbi:hypothetical protein HYFRA_00009238 [Hymenoscyphus fraxineus]|uniref:AMP-activated protein kinase glycogen-binding domain-containing protein n=1 Tax=Hymenoscyphus fraxineus TaxID=746836 RepID=A0A9N9KUH2_9HELO|nr:hypothetical protein HYFRA_00009238 [Hymenoscyphus fraxineus]
MAPPSQFVLVTIKYAKPGTQPPVFLAGSFSSPPWLPQEMQHTTNKDGESEFVKEVLVEEGKEYQYKFRMGTGDWWVLCEDASIVTDDSGNTNNLLSVPQSTEPGRTSAKTSVDLDLNHPIQAPTMGAVNGTSSHTNFNETLNDDIGTPPMSGTPDAAQVAAEVADSAAKLDNGPPSPYVPDEEAGRIGYRRMSSTPIPEVADTAAEVADVAAKLDRPNLSQIEMPSPPMSVEDEELYAPTPEHERVPLFPHECPGPTDKVVKSRASSLRNSSPIVASQSTMDADIDPNDPTLESFPTTREGVYEKIRALETRLPPDESPVTSPAVGRQTERLDLPNPSPRMLAQERSPSLGAIEEEHELDEADRTPSLTETDKQENMGASVSIVGFGNGNGQSSTENRISDTIHKEGSQHTSDNEGIADVTTETEDESTFPEVATNESAKPKTSDENHTSKERPEVATVEERESSISTPEPDDKEKGESPVHENSGTRSADSGEKTTDTQTTTSDIAGDSPDQNVQTRARAPTITIHPATSPQESPEQGISKTSSTTESLNVTVQPVLTPFISNGERQLGHDSKQNEELVASGEGPSITLESATPRASLAPTDSEFSEAQTAGESTSIATSGRSSQLASRKKQRAMTPSPDRPLTPTSIRSNKDDVKSRNFLKAFWRAVFVDWIGGLIASCFGGGRDS